MIIPCGHRILVKPEKVEEKTEGGIYIPETAKGREQQGTMKGVVVEVGPNAWKAFDDGHQWANVGDKVCFKRYAGEVIKDDDGTEYRIMNDEDVLSVFRKEIVQ